MSKSATGNYKNNNRQQTRNQAQLRAPSHQPFQRNSNAPVDAFPLNCASAQRFQYQYVSFVRNRPIEAAIHASGKRQRAAHAPLVPGLPPGNTRSPRLRLESQLACGGATSEARSKAEPWNEVTCQREASASGPSINSTTSNAPLAHATCRHPFPLAPPDRSPQ
ncbi:hypothetical protein Mal15_48360 [Stieleria maiorica]|uniref:Uncharacterized protein n=1 Tax=Stieleria maiorica TaxID=2795974 RepID=A0A5B9MIL6_9BACT|nr:hypothetical protein Mal15_48360 [Stieleria maiorica]